MTRNDDRPDPAKGKLATRSYAESYSEGHRSFADVPIYVAGYADFVLIDAMMSDYVMLDVGSGTGGFFRLARNQSRVVSIDFSPEMTKAAQRLGGELGIDRVEYVCCMFEDYQSNVHFDVVRLTGTFGWYQSWWVSVASLQKAVGLLNSGGLLAVSWVPPRTLFQWMKCKAFPSRTVIITDKDLLKLVLEYGFVLITRIDSDRSCTGIFRKL